MKAETNTEAVRIDKWLWATRFFKTRTLAADAVERGKVRVNGDAVKPARTLKSGETLLIDNGATLWEVVVVGLTDTRRAASIAQAMYQETEASVKKREALAENRRYFSEPTAALRVRPTKRDRRLLDKSGN
jgi:ribosome-associated heat shock protein Hsp15